VSSAAQPQLPAPNSSLAVRLLSALTLAVLRPYHSRPGRSLNMSVVSSCCAACFCCG
jgi:hypothetical protein